MRLFLGIELPENLKAEISFMLDPIRESFKGWENPHDYHMTLLFIGATAEENLPGIKSRMHEISGVPFDLMTTRFQFFNRRIMYLGTEAGNELLRLKDNIVSLFPEYHRENEKSFIPHITVKRWQRYEHAQLTENLVKHPGHPLLIPVKGIALFKSERDSENRKYHVVDRVMF